MLKYNGCLRVNYVSYRPKQGLSGSGQTGGCSSYRTLDREREQLDMLIKKWGSDIVGIDKTSLRKNDFNQIIRPPLRGV